MDIEVRPATKTEQMYCYTQSDQIMGQTGCIGHLRADMGDSGDQFFHDWTSHCERRWRFFEKQSGGISVLLPSDRQCD